MAGKFAGALILLGLGVLYYCATENNLLNPFLFPKVSAIVKAFTKNRDVMLPNLLASLGMMIPSIAISLTLVMLVYAEMYGSRYGMGFFVEEVYGFQFV